MQTLFELNQLVKETASAFSTTKDFAHLKSMRPNEVLLRTVGLLFYAHINQNNQIPPESFFDNLEDFDDFDEEFYYDFKNYIIGTVEYHLADAFINLSILCKNLDIFPYDQRDSLSMGDIDFVYYSSEDKSISDIVFDTIQICPNIEWPITKEEAVIAVREDVFQMLVNILSLAEKIGFDIKKLLDYIKKYETYE